MCQRVHGRLAHSLPLRIYQRRWGQQEWLGQLQVDGMRHNNSWLWPRDFESFLSLSPKLLHEPVVLHLGWGCPRRCLATSRAIFLCHSEGRGHLVDRGQGCCQTSYNSRDLPHGKESPVLKCQQCQGWEKQTQAARNGSLEKVLPVTSMSNCSTWRTPTRRLLFIHSTLPVCHQHIRPCFRYWGYSDESNKKGLCPTRSVTSMTDVQ